MKETRHTMNCYTLYYWPLPFRGQFVRSVLSHVGASWTEAPIDELIKIKDAQTALQPIPHMGPPILTDHNAGISLAQTPAILWYLGSTFELIPNDPARAALTAKLIADANDVLYEMTLHNGAEMWTRPRWDNYRPRLKRWMAIFEEHGRRHGLTVEAGYMQNAATPALVDLVVYILWGVMTTKLPSLRALLEEAAPAIAALSDRIAQLPEQRELRAQSDELYGDAWCGGQIEASLRAVL
ncbi:MAG: glutathione S-transferase [Hyphomicrobiaceae bacterium]